MPIVLKNRTRNSLPENLHHSVALIAKDLKIVCDDGVIDSYQAVFAWASSFLRRQFVGKFVMEDSGSAVSDVYVVGLQAGEDNEYQIGVWFIHSDKRRDGVETSWGALSMLLLTVLTRA